MTRIATFPAQKLASQQAMSIQSRLQETQMQASTGKKSMDYKGLGTDSRRLVSLQSTRTEITQFQKTADTTISRLQMMETSVAGAFDLASDLRTLLVSALNADNGASVALNDQASEMRDELAALMNESLDGRYLFAGTATGTQPVDLAAFDPDDPAYDPDAPTTASGVGYYAGNGETLSVRTSSTQSLEYGVTADDPAFEKLFRAMEMVSTAQAAQENGIDTERLEEALGLANEAMSLIPDLRAEIGAAEKSLDTTKQRFDEQLIYIEENISDIDHVDIAEALTRLTMDETLLQASYTTSIRLSQTTLLNYLR